MRVHSEKMKLCLPKLGIAGLIKALLWESKFGFTPITMVS